MQRLSGKQVGVEAAVADGDVVVAAAGQRIGGGETIGQEGGEMKAAGAAPARPADDDAVVVDGVMLLGVGDGFEDGDLAHADVLPARGTDVNRAIAAGAARAVVGLAGHPVRQPGKAAAGMQIDAQRVLLAPDRNPSAGGTCRAAAARRSWSGPAARRWSCPRTDLSPTWRKSR